MRRTILPVVALTALVPSSVLAQDSGGLRAQVAQAAEAFVDAFNDLDWDRFTPG